MNTLAQLRQSGVLGPLDLQLALTLGRVVDERDQNVLHAIALVSRQLQAGHVCLPLDALANGALLVSEPGNAGEPLVWPSLAQWRQSLEASQLVGDAAANTPLVLDAQHRLYLRRFFEYESRLSASIQGRANRPDLSFDAALLAAGVARLFPVAQRADDLQLTAATSAVKRPLCVISGGPGTGKTATVAKLLALVIEQTLAATGALPRMQLMAPTGKAAARLGEAIRDAKPQLDCRDEVRAGIPEQAVTIARALNGLSSRARGDDSGEGDAKWVTDLVVVDEASMVDLALMTRVFDATPDTARIVLLGDKHQLASVEAGAVLGDICGAGLESAADGGGESRVAALGGLARSICVLKHSYRYRGQSGIGELARAINAGDAEASLEILRSTSFPDVELCDDHTAEAGPRRAQLGLALQRDLLRGYSACLSEPDPLLALTAFGKFRVLCAHRRGARGVEGVNRFALELLQTRGLVERHGSQLVTTPILITQNDYRARLWNGDVGLLMRTQTDRPVSACFVSPDGQLRKLGLSRLPPHESALAMSIHKSQGSEVDEVAVVLPDEASPILTRELLYTAVTRARQRVVIHASAEIVAGAVRRVISRSSGLRDALYASSR